MINSQSFQVSAQILVPGFLLLTQGAKFSSGIKGWDSFDVNGVCFYEVVPRPKTTFACSGFSDQTHLPAPNMTEGLLVLVQLVMAAITTEPWVSSKSEPL